MWNRFYPRWIAANAWAEGIGLGSTLLLGVLAAGVLEQQPGATAIVAAALVAVALGTVFEGVVVGLAQARVLRDRIPALPGRQWTLATAAGAGAAWTLGMIPSTVLALTVSPAAPDTSAPQEPAAWVQYALALAMGLVLGPVLALAQVRVLRAHVRRPYRWLWANSVAWALGMAAIFIGMDRVPWGEGALAIGLGVAAVCVAAGAVVGAIHGWYLRLLLAESLGG